MENKEILYTVLETAKLLRIGKNSVYDLIKKGDLKALNLNGLKIRASQIEAFLNKLESEGNN